MSNEFIKRMSREDRERQKAQQDEATYRMNLERAIRERDSNQTGFYRRALAESLILQGKLEEAALIVSRHLKLRDYHADVLELIEAVKRPDAHRCACVDDIATERVPGNHIVPQTRSVTLSRYSPRRTFFSEQHDSMVTLYECAKCHHKNAIPDFPDQLTRKIDHARIHFPDEDQGPDHHVLESK